MCKSGSIAADAVVRAVDWNDVCV